MTGEAPHSIRDVVAAFYRLPVPVQRVALAIESLDDPGDQWSYTIEPAYPAIGVHLRLDRCRHRSRLVRPSTDGTGRWYVSQTYEFADMRDTVEAAVAAVRERLTSQR